METIQIRLIDGNQRIETLDRKAAELYLSAKEQVDLLDEIVISPFEQALKRETGYGKENPPAQKEASRISAGKYAFNIESTPSSSTAYAGIISRMNVFLEDIANCNGNGIKRAGVRTLEDTPYIQLSEINEKLDDLFRENTTETVSQKVKDKDKKETLVEMLQTLELYFRQGYETLNTDNAHTYIVAKNQKKKIKSAVIEPFESLVKESTGLSKENPPAQTEVLRQVIGNILCQTASIPYEEISYGEVFKGFSAYLTDLSSEAERSQRPELRRFNSDDYVSINALQQKISKLTRENTKQGLRQSTDYLRLPKDEKLVVF